MSYPIIAHDLPAAETNRTTGTDGTPKRETLTVSETRTYDDGSMAVIGIFLAAAALVVLAWAACAGLAKLLLEVA